MADHLFCTQDNLKDYILQAYLDAVENENPGAIDRTISNVSGELLEAILQGGYLIPDAKESATLTRICAVISAYRCVGEITSLMDTEAGSGNEWLPLQTQYRQAEKDLALIRAGKLDPFPAETATVTEAAAGDTGISVAAPQPMFGADVWERY